jgi:hypothetical protein
MKQSLNYLLLWALLLVSLFSCDKEESVVSSYLFPLLIGDQWKYNNDELWEITAQKEIGGNSYYEMSYGNSHNYFRVENTKIYALGSDYNEYIQFNLALNEGESWHFAESAFYNELWNGTLLNKNDT